MKRSTCGLNRLAPAAGGVVLSLGIGMAPGAAYAQATWYVDAAGDPANGCASWLAACPDLQTALDLAGIGDEIWVAEGTYVPSQQSEPGTPRTETFQLINDVAVYGGFPAGGGDATFDARNPTTYETILSGDLNGDDETGGDNSENSYHVVTGSGTEATAVLDGFTITGGNADGAAPHNSGAGMYNDNGSPTVADCTFTRNNASWGGGGMYNLSSSPALLNCVFIRNQAVLGGGMLNYQSNPTVTNCTFSGNIGPYGGGIVNQEGSPTLTNCTFSGNRADVHGGGMLNYQSNPTVTNCTFSGNVATDTGGMFNDSGSPTVTNCILWGDTGGEIHNDGSTLTLTYSDVQGGYAGDGNIDADPLFVDADGLDNVFGTEDDDLHLQDGSPCVNAGDNAALPGDVTTDFEGDNRIQQGRVDMGADETPYWLDCNDNGVADASDVDPSDPDGNGEVSEDCNTDFIPDECEVPVTSGGLCTVDCDPDCNANGVPDACDVDPTDPDGNGEVSADNNANDIPDECEARVHVDDDAQTGGDGTTWATAYKYVQDALAGAGPDGVILVAGGTQKPDQDEAGNVTPGDRAATIRLVDGVMLWGGVPRMPRRRLRER